MTDESLSTTSLPIAGEMVGDRDKLGNVIRIGVLWDRTATALRKIRRRADGPDRRRR